MLKRSKNILNLIILTTTITTLFPSLEVFAADTLEGKKGEFSNVIAYSNKYLYDGYRGDEDEKTVLYYNGKYNELEDTDIYGDAKKYDSNYIELDNDRSKNLFNLQTSKFEDETIEDQEEKIKDKLIRNLKSTERYGDDVGKYVNLDKNISSNKGNFGEVWYQYSVDYNGIDDENTRYITTIDINAKSNDSWDNITLKKGEGIESELFGDQYQFWFSIEADEADNKELDGQSKTFNGDIEVASNYIAGRIKDYCGYDAKVIEKNEGSDISKPIIQIISIKSLDEDVIISHNNDITVSTKKTSLENIDEDSVIQDTSEDSGILEGTDTAENSDVPGDSDNSNETVTQYETIINIKRETANEWQHIKLKKGEEIDSDEFGEEYDFWFSISANETENKELDGQAKTYNGDIEAASNYIAGRIKDYCGYENVSVDTVDGNIVIKIVSDKNPEESILDKDSDFSIETESTNILTENNNLVMEEAINENNLAKESNILEENQLPKYYGIVNNSGRYIDISNAANIKFLYKVNNEAKRVNIKEFGKKYGEENIQANLTSLDVLAQDSSYVYARVNVEFTSDSTIDIVNQDSENSKEYILKISKAREDKVDGAFIPKEVNAYELNGESDFKSWIQPKVNDDWYCLDIFANKGSIYIVRFNKDGENKKNEIQCIQIDFQSSVDTSLGIGRNKIVKICDPSVSTGLKNKLIETTDADEIRELIKPYYSIDSEGNLWVLGSRRIYMLNGSGFNEEFTIPGGISNLDVYNKSSLVAWSDDGEYVSNINEYEKEDDVEDDNVEDDNNQADDKEFEDSDYETNIHKGWVQTKQGWKFFDDEGYQVKNSWIQVGEKWYLINENGIMMTEWTNLGENRYYLNEDGSMSTGWKKINDKWYYFKSDGSMARKWERIDGTWYYLNESGEMQIGWINDSDNWYHLGTDGEMSTGWLKYSKNWYYLDEGGKMLTNITIDGYKIGSYGTLI